MLLARLSDAAIFPKSETAVYSVNLLNATSRVGSKEDLFPPREFREESRLHVMQRLSAKSKIGELWLSLPQARAIGLRPVIDPDLQPFVFTPIEPVPVFHPIVFAASSPVEVELIKPRTAVIVIEGTSNQGNG